MHCRRKRDVSLLVIEDSEPELELMAYLLQQVGGYCVMTAKDGESGLALADHEKVNLVICDIFLPGINGYEVARRLKTHAGLGRVPLLAVTTLTQVANKERLREAGFDGFIGKPIDVRKFVDNVESVLALAGDGARFSPPSSSKGWRILILDDLPMYAKHLSAGLEAMGHQVCIVGDTARATEMLNTGGFDLIVADLHLAEGENFKFLSDVKVNRQQRDLPLLFLSASLWKDQDRPVFLSLPHTRCLRRPVNATHLLEEIVDYLNEGEADPLWRPS